MVKEISWEDPRKREEDLDIIMREADRLTALVNEILEFSAMQADVSVKEYGMIDISRGVRDVIGQFAPFCEKNGFVIESEITDGLWAAADEDIPYIWDRYYTARSRKNREAVSGLGLSIAREILTFHRAKYGVDNRKNCTFWFELPVPRS